MKMRVKKTFLYIIVIIACLIVFFPFYWMLNTALLEKDDLFKIPPQLYSTANPITFIKEYLTEHPFLLWLKNSLIVSVSATAISTILAILGAFSLSRFRYRGRTSFFFFSLLTQMMPPVFLVIPIFVIFQYLKLNDSLFGLIVIYMAITLPIGLFFLKGFFDSIPKNLDDAAAIDGCNKLQTLYKVILPLVLPGIVATATWSFIIVWVEFVLAYTMTSSSKNWVLSVGLSSHIGQYLTSWNVIMMGAVLATLPIVILFMFFQRLLIKGLTAGSLKE